MLRTNIAVPDLEPFVILLVTFDVVAALITTVPLESAVTLPLASTVAILLSEEEKARGLSANSGLSSTIRLKPLISVSVPFVPIWTV